MMKKLRRSQTKAGLKKIAPLMLFGPLSRFSTN